MWIEYSIELLFKICPIEKWINEILDCYLSINRNGKFILCTCRYPHVRAVGLDFDKTVQEKGQSLNPTPDYWISIILLRIIFSYNNGL